MPKKKLTDGLNREEIHTLIENLQDALFSEIINPDNISTLDTKIAVEIPHNQMIQISFKTALKTLTKLPGAANNLSFSRFGKKTFLSMVIQNKNLLLIDYLINSEISLTQGNAGIQNGLHLAMLYGIQDKVVLEKIISVLNTHHELNIRDSQGQTALHYAVKSGIVENVLILLRNQADPNLLTEGKEPGKSIFELTIERNDLELLKALIEQLGVDKINEPNSKGETLLDLSAKYFTNSITEWLKEKGAMSHNPKTIERLNHITLDEWGGEIAAEQNFIIDRENPQFNGIEEVLIAEQPTLKGLSLMMGYFAIKEQNPNQPFVCNSKTVLKHAMESMMSGGDPLELTFIFQNPDIGLHRQALKIEKYNGHFHIILMDSAIQSEVRYLQEIKNFIKQFPELKGHVTLYHNREQRQVDNFSCGVFATKDARKMCRKQAMHKELGTTYQKRIYRDEESGLDCCQYTLPPEHMKSAQSPNAINQYQKTVPDNILLSNVRRADKPMETFSQTIERYSTLQSNSRPNTRLSRYILQFSEKYAKTIRTMLKSLNEKEIRELEHLYHLEQFPIHLQQSRNHPEIVSQTLADKVPVKRPLILRSFEKRNKGRLEPEDSPSEVVPPLKPKDT